MNEKNRQYAILDKMLADSQQGRGRRWVCPTPSKPTEGYWIDSDETFEDLQRSNDAIEAYLRS